MSLNKLLAEIEAVVGTYSTDQTTASPDQDLKQAQQLLTKLGGSEQANTSLSTQSNGTINSPVVIKKIDENDALSKLNPSNTRINRLFNSNKIYVNTDIIRAEIFTHTAQTANCPNAAVGICHVQEIDLLTHHNTPRTINEDEPTLLLLSSPVLNFASGTASSLSKINQYKLITGMYRTLFSATIKENREYITMAAAELNIFCIDDANLSFEILMSVAKEFPELNIIYNPKELEFEFDAQLNKFNPTNVVKAEKNILFIANKLTQKGYPCAVHNPSDSNVVYGLLDIAKKKDSKINASCSLSESINKITTEPLNGRGLNPEADERVIDLSLITPILEEPKPTVTVTKFTDLQLEAIKTLIDVLENEIESHWPYPNKDLKKLKVNAWKKLIEYNQIDSVDVSLDTFKIVYKEAVGGFFSSRTKKLLDDLAATPNNSNQI